MLESLRKIESLDVKRVYPGHGRPFTDFKKALLKSKARIEKYNLHQDLIGEDLIKKLIVFTLMMKKTMGEDEFFSYLMGTFWYKETVDLYFNGEHEIKYNEIMDTFLNRGIIKKKNGKLVTIIKP